MTAKGPSDPVRIVEPDFTDGSAVVSMGLSNANVGGLLSACGTTAALGDTMLIAAPAAGQRIVLTSVLLQNEGANPVTLSLEDAGTAFLRVLCPEVGDGVSRNYAPGREKRLTAATALVLNLSAAQSCGYSVDYFLETA